MCLTNIFCKTMLPVNQDKRCLMCEGNSLSVICCDEWKTSVNTFYRPTFTQNDLPNWFLQLKCMRPFSCKITVGGIKFQGPDLLQEMPVPALLSCQKMLSNRNTLRHSSSMLKWLKIWNKWNLNWCFSLQRKGSCSHILLIPFNPLESDGTLIKPTNYIFCSIFAGIRGRYQCHLWIGADSMYSS